MKILYIVRHAKSSWDYPRLSDAERPLNKRGKRDAPRMAQYLADRIERPDALISSYAIRAKDTAKEFMKALKVNGVDIEPSLYHASVSTWYAVISSLDYTLDSVMLFGHNPGLTYFVNDLCEEAIYNIPTCGVAGIKLNIDSWSRVATGAGQLAFYYYPKGIDWTVI